MATRTSQKVYREAPIPAHAGIGLRADHYSDVLEKRPDVPWFEVHSENFFGDGGERLTVLEAVRHDYPVSFHSVGLSLGSTDPLSIDHLNKLSNLIQRFQPGLVSEHLSWSSVNGIYLNDLLPLPYTEEALSHFCQRVEQTQTFIGRRILVENPSTYLQFVESTIPEHEFIVEVAKRTGCGILLDVNNVYVQSRNHGLSPAGYLNHIPGELVEEVHLAGHVEKVLEAGSLVIDSHDQHVSAPVWQLYRSLIERIGPRPTLIEWDSSLPTLPVLMEEASVAEAILEASHAVAS